MNLRYKRLKSGEKQLQYIPWDYATDEPPSKTWLVVPTYRSIPKKKKARVIFMKKNPNGTPRFLDWADHVHLDWHGEWVKFREVVE